VQEDLAKGELIRVLEDWCRHSAVIITTIPTGGTPRLLSLLWSRLSAYGRKGSIRLLPRIPPALGVGDLGRQRVASENWSVISSMVGWKPKDSNRR
jgi:hypothetical protein